jgi:flagellar hook-basal body complex protein FliE
MPVVPVGSLTTPPALVPAASSSTASSPGQPFGATLARLVNSVEESGAAANDAVTRMLDGSGDVHEAMIAMQRSDTTFQFAVQVRNKLVQAYQDIMRMPV